MDKKVKRTQIGDVLEYMQTHPYITDAIATSKFNAYRLSGIIFALRKKGYDIKTVLVTKKNKYGTSSTYAEYYLEG